MTPIVASLADLFAAARLRVAHGVVHLQWIDPANEPAAAKATRDHLDTLRAAIVSAEGLMRTGHGAEAVRFLGEAMGC